MNQYSEEDYDHIELNGEQTCLFCNHRRVEHDYNPSESILPDHPCLKCKCHGFNLSYDDEFWYVHLKGWKRMYRRIFKGEKTKTIISISRKLKPVTQKEIAEIKRLYCKND